MSKELSEVQIMKRKIELEVESERKAFDKERQFLISQSTIAPDRLRKHLKDTIGEMEETEREQVPLGGLKESEQPSDSGEKKEVNP